MDSVQINEVVDKLADRLGMAAEQLVPITQTLVEETARNYTIHGIGTLCIALLFGAVSTWAAIQAKKTCRHDDGELFSGLVAAWAVCGLATIISIGIMFSNFADAASPTLMLLKEVL